VKFPKYAELKNGELPASLNKEFIQLIIQINVMQLHHRNFPLIFPIPLVERKTA
jgi:hypothetical protein